MNSAIQQAIERIVTSGLAAPREIGGCTEGELQELERLVGLPLPPVYGDFLRAMGHGAGGFLQGTDLWFADLGDINEAAVELVEEAEDVSLPDSAFVFAMHQGYQFLFFVASGAADPEVFRFVEEDGIATVATTFSAWLRRAIEDEIRARKI